MLYWIYRKFFSKFVRKILAAESCFDFSSDREVKQIIQRSFRNVKVNKVEGDYYEFGLFRGRSFLYALGMVKNFKYQGKKMKCLGFDSFEDLPEPAAAEDEFVDSLGEAKWKKGDFSVSYEEFKNILHRQNVPPDLYELYPGFFERSLTPQLQGKLNKAAIVHIDCDLYVSAKTVLSFMKPLLQQGTIIIFDDYYCYKADPDKGEAKAVAEFLQKNNDIEFISWGRHKSVGKSFIVNFPQK